MNGLVQQLSCNYLPHGYWFYVLGQVPDKKDPLAIDAKLIEKYGIDRTRSQRYRRKQAGYANLHYLRHDRMFLLLATHGKHPFFEEEAARIKDCRRTPIKIGGYAISVKQVMFPKQGACRLTEGKLIKELKHRVHVRIEMEEFRNLKARCMTWWRLAPSDITEKFRDLSFEPYAPVFEQWIRLLRIINRKRKQAGLSVLNYSLLRKQRWIVQPFYRIESVPKRDSRCSTPFGIND